MHSLNKRERGSWCMEGQLITLLSDTVYFGYWDLKRQALEQQAANQHFTSRLSGTSFTVVFLMIFPIFVTNMSALQRS